MSKARGKAPEMKVHENKADWIVRAVLLDGQDFDAAVAHVRANTVTVDAAKAGVADKLAVIAQRVQS